MMYCPRIPLLILLTLPHSNPQQPLLLGPHLHSLPRTISAGPVVVTKDLGFEKERREERMGGEAVVNETRNEESMASVSESPSSCSSHHKRSRSASERNPGIARNGNSYCMGKDCTESKQDIVRSHGGQDSSNQVSSDTTNATLDPQASLENDIKKLQMHLHQEKYMRVMLERAIGRASSTLSPGHRHFATQTKLISEIELLEEEIANREQHVLSLYRTIFDQCVSAPSSAQSSGMASPAHTKTGARKHPSIISSTFCSSKKFPLKTLNVLASIKESGKSNLFTKPVRNEALSSGNRKFRVERNFSDPVEKLPSAGRSYLTHTLKEHLYECPSKLSEELVRCMAAIYCWVGSKASVNSEKVHSPFLSQTSTSVILPRQTDGDPQESCQSIVEVTSISMDKNQFSSASCAISKYRLLVEQLERVDLCALENNVKLAFWINVYNCLIMHAYLSYGIPHSSLRRMALFNKAAYNIGGHTINANFIENSILCCRTPRLGRWFETIISTAMRKKYGEEKKLMNSKIALFTCQPLVFFALCNGAASDPVLRVYTAKNILDELDKATKEFLQANVVVKKSGKIYLPKILERFSKETSLTCDDLFKWLLENVDKKMQETIEKCSDCKNRRKASQVIEWLPYNTRFGYVFGKDLTEKPWWV